MAFPLRHTLFTRAQARRADDLAIAGGIPGFQLMRSAAEGMARAIRARFPLQPILFLCGPGNNGGDGLVLAEILRQDGWPVRVVLMRPPEGYKGDAAQAFHGFRGSYALLHDDCLGAEALVVDALYGTGLDRPIVGAEAELIERLNEAGRTVISVDIPSGLCADSGRTFGVRAQSYINLTFNMNKIGYIIDINNINKSYNIRIDINIPQAVNREIGSVFAINHPDLWQDFLPALKPDAHKYSRGGLLLLQGADMPGAALMAAQTARRIGAGIVGLTGMDASREISSCAPGLLSFPIKGAKDWVRVLAAKPWRAVVVGPGAEPEMARDILQSWDRIDRPAVLDADALTAFADDPETLFARIREKPVVLTPHAGEFARLFCAFDDPGKPNYLRAQAAARLCGTIVVLKGPQTFIAHPDGRVVIHAEGSPNLATAGTGDVLSGAIGGLMAQGMEPFSAAMAAVWGHAHAAKKNALDLIAEDLISELPRLIHAPK